MLWQFPCSEHLLFIEAALWLGIAKLLLLLIPFRWVAPFLGRHMAVSPAMIDQDSRDCKECISLAVQRATRYLPWECKCLVQAMAGKAMLKCRGIKSTLYLGVAKDNDQNLTSHAWLRSGTMVITGAQGMSQFKIISTFAEEGL